jgi:hypothetical protein
MPEEAREALTRAAASKPEIDGDMPHNGDRHEYNRGIKLELTELDAE